MTARFHRTLVIFILTLTLFLVSCKSDCARLCARQQQCSASTEDDSTTMLRVENQRELCAVVCEAVLEDEKKRSGMRKALKCADSECTDFQECMASAAAD
ncbi:MAG TPA: hypothetical protein EYN06_08815 [Myxococcales bacterium]|nr:hypothetical protein [Myxococcales bacterium]HIN86567.1 hypothetical protein [Myxococcales bacterium]